MDFSKIDARAKAEEGAALHLVHPETGGAIGDANAPATVWVRGMSSRSVQESMRRAVRDAKAKGKKGKEAQIECMEDLLAMQIDQCAPFIIRFENIDYQGRDPNEDEEARKAVLGCFLPRMKVKTDADGAPDLDDDGSPEFEVVNNTFPAQILAFAEKMETERGNASTA